MPSYVDPEKCDGCKGGDKTACMYICPNDLMVLEPNEMKAYNQEPDQCWECFSCVKIFESFEFISYPKRKPPAAIPIIIGIDK